MRIESVYHPRAPLRMTARNPRSESTGVENGWVESGFHSSLHAPSPLVSNAAESDNLSED